MMTFEQQRGQGGTDETWRSAATRSGAGQYGQWAGPPRPDGPGIGAMGPIPWTARQTAIGVAATLVPWLLFLALTSRAGGRTLTAPLPRGVDIGGGIFAFVVGSLVEGAFLIAPLVIALGRRPPDVSARARLRALGFRSAPLWRSLAYIAGGFVLILAANYLTTILNDALKLNLTTNTEQLLNEARYAPITVFGTLLGGVLIAPLCEEVFFRGFALPGFARAMAPWAAVVLTAGLFALVHGSIGSFVTLFVFGVVNALIRWRLGSIWPCIALHTLNNVLATIGLLVLLR